MTLSKGALFKAPKESSCLNLKIRSREETFEHSIGRRQEFEQASELAMEMVAHNYVHILIKIVKLQSCATIFMDSSLACPSYRLQLG